MNSSDLSFIHFHTDSNTQSSDIYTLSTNSGSENSKASSSDTSPALRHSSNQSRLSGSSRPISDRHSSTNPKCVSEGSVSPFGHSSYSATTAADVCADNQTVINLGEFTPYDICYFAFQMDVHFVLDLDTSKTSNSSNRQALLPWGTQSRSVLLKDNKKHQLI